MYIELTFKFKTSTVLRTSGGDARSENQVSR